MLRGGLLHFDAATDLAVLIYAAAGKRARAPWDDLLHDRGRGLALRRWPALFDVDLECVAIVIGIELDEASARR
jgi:hypothetical protein